MGKRLKREIPLLWKAKMVEEVADVYNGATPSTVNELNYGGDIVWITPKDLSDQKQKFSIKESEISLKLDMILVVLICYLQTQY